MDITFNVGELKKLVAESSIQNKPRIGDGVESKNKSENEKTYEESKKKTKKFNSGAKKEEDFARGDAKYEKTDDNHTTLGYNPENVSDDYKKRIKAQAMGYTSELEKNNGIEKAADFSNNEKIFNGITKNEKEMDDNVEILKKSGLQGSHMPDNFFKKETIYESQDGVDMRNSINKFKMNFKEHKLNENKNIKTVYFKKTEFLTEEHMFTKIPDEFKNEGEQFKMKDKCGNEYIVEWTNNSPYILEHTNKNLFNESLNKIKELSSYKAQQLKSQHDDDVFESNMSKSLSESLKIMRKMNKL